MTSCNIVDGGVCFGRTYHLAQFLPKTEVSGRDIPVGRSILVRA